MSRSVLILLTIAVFLPMAVFNSPLLYDKLICGWAGASDRGDTDTFPCGETIAMVMSFIPAAIESMLKLQTRSGILVVSLISDVSRMSDDFLSDAL